MHYLHLLEYSLKAFWCHCQYLEAGPVSIDNGTRKVLLNIQVKILYSEVNLNLLI
jgi:hypothetical protein